MDYIAMTTVTNSIRYHVEGFDAETGQWIRVQPGERSEFYSIDDLEGFAYQLDAGAYASVVRKRAEGGSHKVRIVEEITMRASRVTMEQ